MRLIITIICLLTSFGDGYGQTKQMLISSKDLIGVWQINGPMIADAMQKCFRFYKNGKFVLDYSQYDDLARIKRVEGTYKIEDSILYLTINSRTERKGGKLIAGSMGFQSEEFVLDSTSTVVIKQQNETPEGFRFRTIEPKDNAKGIEINNSKYYKISGDPDKYKD